MSTISQKRKKGIKNLFLIAPVLFAVIVFSSCNSCNNTQSQQGAKEFAIACNLPLTGDMAVYGVSVQNGIEFALEDLKKSGKLDSLSLKVDFQDNKSSNADAVSLLNKQLLNSPQVYVSGLDHQTSAIIDKISASGVPHFTYSWEPFICKKGENNFRTGINLEQESDYYVKFIQHNNPKKIAILHVNDPGSFLQFDSLVIPRAKQAGVVDFMYEAFDAAAGSDGGDFKVLATKVKAYKPDMIIVAAYDFQLVQLVKDFRNNNLIKADNMMCSVDLLDAMPNLTPELLEGLRVTCPQFVYNSSPEVADWKNRFTKKYNRPAKYGDAYAYDMTYIIYNAAKKANGNYALPNLVSLIKATDMNGITGHLAFNSNRDLSLNLDVCSFKAGTAVKEGY